MVWVYVCAQSQKGVLNLSPTTYRFSISTKWACAPKIIDTFEHKHIMNFKNNFTLEKYAYIFPFYC